MKAHQGLKDINNIVLAKNRLFGGRKLRQQIITFLTVENDSTFAYNEPIVQKETFKIVVLIDYTMYNTTNIFQNQRQTFQFNASSCQKREL